VGERNGYTSFILPGGDNFDYTGGEKLDYPWKNGYHYLEDNKSQTTTIFELKPHQVMIL
jgi:hypothetical protein